MRVEHDKDGTRTLWVRQSSLGDLLMCPERVRNDMLGRTVRRSNDAAAIGTALHAAIESDIKDAFACVDDMIDFAQVTLTGIDEAEGVLWVGDENTARYWLDLFCRRWWQFSCRHELIEGFLAGTVEVERPFDVPFFEVDGWRVRLEGTIDVVDLTHDEIVDWKTASSPYKSWEKRRWAVQPVVYTYAATHLLGDRDWLFVYWQFVKQHDDIGPHRLDVRRDERHWRWLKEQIISLLPLLEDPERPWLKNDNGWWCSERWCRAWEFCKGAHTPDIKTWEGNG